MVIVGAALAAVAMAFLTPKRTSSDRTVTIHADQLPAEMRDYAVHVVNDAIDARDTIDDMADYIKKSMDEKYSPAWCCVLGWSFASVVRHEAGWYVHFSIDHLTVALWKCGDGEQPGSRVKPAE
jgi:hypothetical protein